MGAVFAIKETMLRKTWTSLLTFIFAFTHSVAGHALAHDISNDDTQPIRVSALAPAPTDAPVDFHNSQVFVATSIPLKTPDGNTVRLEVTSFNIRTAADLATAEEWIRSKFSLAQAQPQDGQFEISEIDISNPTEFNPAQVDLDTKANETVGRVSKLSKAWRVIREKLHPPQEGYKHLFAKGWNLNLTIYRTIMNFATSSAGLIFGKGIPWTAAVPTALVLAAASGGIQLDMDRLSTWMDTGHYVTGEDAHDAGVYKAIKNLKGLPKLKHHVKRMGRWGIVEVNVAVLVAAAMWMFGIPVEPHSVEVMGATIQLGIFDAVWKTMASQGVLELGVMNVSEVLGTMNPAWTGKQKYFKGVSFLMGSGVWAFAAMCDFIGVHLGNAAFVAMGAAGAVLALLPRMINTGFGQRILDMMFPARVLARKMPSPNEPIDLDERHYNLEKYLQRPPSYESRVNTQPIDLDERHYNLEQHMSPLAASPSRISCGEYLKGARKAE